MTGNESDSPLLEPGLHRVSLPRLRDLCVAPFPESRTRQDIMAGLEKLIDMLIGHGVRGELWVNGSFLTYRQHPNDGDVLLVVSSEVYDDGTELQRQGVDLFRDNANRWCDCYVVVVYPRSHRLYHDGEALRTYWTEHFGRGRDRRPKGIAVVEIGG